MSTATASIARDEFFAEALSYCERHIRGFTEKDVATLGDSLRHRAYLQEIEPLLKAKVRLYSCVLPTITICESGHIETQYHLSEEQQKALDDCDRLIAAVAEKYRASDNTGESHG